ncbi:hypothetical protein WJX72_003214 [[Myrmecia] bisecta]|uniref:Uncharacterized protein n=1 Tax=[Myrmecia] bisecta TaxID=41462 RepID=A0AAW1QEL7_9CHLO
MFVMNCRVKSKAVAAPAAPQGGKRKRSRQGQDQAGTQEQFYPVECAECGTQVAMRDKDEVYHFYQVVASSA